MTPKPISKRINKPENNDPSVLKESEMEQVGRLIFDDRLRSSLAR
jgi:hypothetical protein